MPTSMPMAVCGLSHSVLRAAHQVRYYHFPRFTDAESEASKGEITPLGSHSYFSVCKIHAVNYGSIYNTDFILPQSL